MSKNYVLRTCVEIKKLLPIKQSLRGFVNSLQAKSPGFALWWHSFIAIAVALVVIKLFIDPGNDRNFLRISAIGLRDDPLSNDPERLRLFVGEKAKQWNFFKTLAHDLARLIVPVR